MKHPITLTAVRRLARWLILSLDQLRINNRTYCDNLHWKPQLLHGLMLSESNATHDENQSKLGSTYLPSGKNHKDSSQYQIYLCEYIYGSKKWLVEIAATSRSDAAARLKAISSGTVLGPIHARIPAEAGWIAKLMVFLRNSFRR